MKRGKAVWNTEIDIIDRQLDPQGFIQPSEWLTQCTLINAGTGCGKTKDWKKKIIKLNPKRALFVAPRIQMVETLKGLFPQCQTYIENIHANWLICQYESLHKIKKGTYDVVVVDEVRSICQNMTSEKTNHLKLQDNALALEFFMTNSTKTILLDADAEADSAVNDVITQIFAPGQIRVERYEEQKMKRTIELKAKCDWWKQLDDCMRKGMKLGIPCRSKKAAHIVEQRCKELNVKYKIYTSRSNDSAMKDFQRVDEVWSEVQVVIFSSKVTVGADCTVPFDKIFIHAGGSGGCSAREILQMQARFRHIVDETMVCIIPSQIQPNVNDWTLDNCLLFYSERKDTVTDNMSSVIKFLPALDEYRNIHWAPDAITRVFAHARSERLRPFSGDLFQKASDKGYSIFDKRYSSTMSEEAQKLALASIKGTTDTSSKCELKSNTDLYERLLVDKIYIKQAIQSDINIRRQNATPEDRMVVQMAAILDHYPSDQKYEYKTFDLMVENREQIKNIAAVNQIKPDYTDPKLALICESEMIAISKTTWADVRTGCPLFSTVYIKLHDTVTKLGCSGLFDFEASISSDTIIQHAGEIKHACIEVSKLRGEKWRPSTRKDDKLCVVTASILSKQIKSLFRIQLKLQRNGSYSIIPSNKEVHTLSAASDYYKQGAWLQLPSVDNDRIVEEFDMYDPGTGVYTDAVVRSGISV
jgi:hypothetical protein